MFEFMVRSLQCIIHCLRNDMKINFNFQYLAIFPISLPLNMVLYMSLYAKTFQSPSL